VNHVVGLIPIAVAVAAFVAARTAPDRMIAFNRRIHGRPLSTERLMWWWFTAIFCVVGITALIIGIRVLATGH